MHFIYTPKSKVFIIQIALFDIGSLFIYLFMQVDFAPNSQQRNYEINIE